MGIHGYDPDMENFDQTPYHYNESGSQDTTTLAQTGGICPLLGQHDHTRRRWTANVTTFRNAERIRSGGEMPYAEFMFRHDDKTGNFDMRLNEHIRKCGYGKWVTVTTSPSGSYREADVVEFLDRHLAPCDPQLRGWRILFCDDFGPHKSHNVRNLAWARGYVVVVLPGGATPIVQTPDTDLNQWVRKSYIALETAAHKTVQARSVDAVAYARDHDRPHGGSAQP